MAYKREIASKRIVAAYCTSLLGIASGLLNSLWIVRELSTRVTVEEFGLYGYALQICGYLAILQLGLDFAAAREIAEQLGRGNAGAAVATFHSVRRYSILSLLVAALALLGACISLPQWGAKVGSGQTIFYELLMLVGSAQLVGFIVRPMNAALIGSGSQSILNTINVARTIGVALCSYGLLQHNYGVLAVPISELILWLAVIPLLVFVLQRKCSWIANKDRCGGVVEKKRLFLYSISAAFGGLAWTIESSLDVFLLGYFLGPSFVASYVLWWRFPQMAFEMNSRLAFSSFPELARVFGQGPAALQQLIGQVFAWSAGLGGLAFIGISMWLGPVVGMWVGFEFAGYQPASLASLFGLLVCLRTIGNLFSTAWMSQGRSGTSTILAWMQAALKFILALWLIPKWGLVGAAVASCAAASLQVAGVGACLWRNRLLNFASVKLCGILFTIAGVLVLCVPRFTEAHSVLGLVSGVVGTTAAWGLCWALVSGRVRPASCRIIGNRA